MSSLEGSSVSEPAQTMYLHTYQRFWSFVRGTGRLLDNAMLMDLALLDYLDHL
jgi:hypothetical protein